MRGIELSKAFDAYLNSWISQLYGTNNGGTLVLNEYEKSLFLTEAQRTLILEIYRGDVNATLGIDKTSLSKVYLKNLIKQAYLEEPVTETPLAGYNQYTSPLPADCFLILNEVVYLDDDLDNAVAVYPISFDALNKQLRNPYRNPNHSRVLRTMHGDLINYYSAEPITEIQITYLETIPPIIVTNLLDGVTLEGYTTDTPPVLPSELHSLLIKKAVELAYTYMAPQSNVESNTD